MSEEQIETIGIKNPRLATIEEACSHLHISRTSLYRLMQRKVAVGRKMPLLGARIDLIETEKNLSITGRTFLN